MPTQESTGQSPLVSAYFALVDASGLSDEEFDMMVERVTAEQQRQDGDES